MKMRITVEGKTYEVEVEMLDDGEAGVRGPTVSAASNQVAAPTPPAPSAAPAKAPAKPAATPAPAASSSGDGGEVKSPIAGNVISVKVKPGDTVTINQEILLLEAMKMETSVASPVAGTVQEVLVNDGQAVNAGQVLVKIA